MGRTHLRDHRRSHRQEARQAQKGDLMDYFGPYLRLSYATTDASVTGTVWVAVKE